MTAVDNDQNKVFTISRGEVPFWEPGLKDALNRHLNKLVHPTSEYKFMVSNSRIIFICVGTPEKENGSADLQYIYSAIESVVKSINDNSPRLILIKSTVPPGTAQEVKKHLLSKFEHISYVSIGSNPEFLREGHALEDFVDPDRIVIGLDEETEWKETLEEIYGKFCNSIFFTGSRTAEFTKYLSNSFLSTLISFSNEMSLVARSIGGIDIRKSFELIHQDRRFMGTPAPIISYLYPGCGYGGYCLPKDTKAIVALSESYKFNAELLKMNISLNEKIMGKLLEDVFNSYPNSNTKIGVLGLSFKPGSDDVRDSPAEKCLSILNSRGYHNVYAYDPIATNNFRELNKTLDVRYTETAEDTISSSDVIIVVTAWDVFRQSLANTDKKIFDFRYFI